MLVWKASKRRPEKREGKGAELKWVILQPPHLCTVALVFACPTECLWVAAQAWLPGPVQAGRRKLGGGRAEEGCDALQAGGGV